MPFFMRDADRIYSTREFKTIELVRASKPPREESKHSPVEDTTLSRHGPGASEPERPLQYEYPVWYFLVGQASNEYTLEELLKHRRLPYTRAAMVDGLTTLQGVHCGGLVHATVKTCASGPASTVGRAYLVRNKLEEDRLRYFHTSLYTVVSATA